MQRHIIQSLLDTDLYKFTMCCTVSPKRTACMNSAAAT